MSGIHSAPCRSAVLHVGGVSSELHYPWLNGWQGARALINSVANRTETHWLLLCLGECAGLGSTPSM